MGSRTSSTKPERWYGAERLTHDERLGSAVLPFVVRLLCISIYTTNPEPMVNSDTVCISSLGKSNATGTWPRAIARSLPATRKLCLNSLNSAISTQLFCLHFFGRDTPPTNL